MRAGTLRLRLRISVFCFSQEYKTGVDRQQKLSFIGNQCLLVKKFNFCPFLTDHAEELFSSHMTEFHLEALESEMGGGPRSAAGFTPLENQCRVCL